MTRMTGLTRREFLDFVARQSAAASIAASALLVACRSTADRRSALGLDANATKTLIALIDEIVPAVSGMPAASQVGTLAYFELLAGTESKLAETVQATVRGVEALGRERFANGLSLIRPEQRRVAVSAFSEANPALFAQIRNYVYEGYYLDPRVWELLGYEPHPTGSGGPKMASFDAALLSRVRAMPIRYRKV